MRLAWKTSRRSSRDGRPTQALVIDELDNPGGQSYYLDAVASLLITEPEATAKFYVTLSTSTMGEANQEISELAKATTDALVQKALGSTDYNGYPITSRWARAWMTTISSWSRSKRAGLHLSAAHYRKLETLSRARGRPHTRSRS